MIKDQLWKAILKQEWRHVIKFFFPKFTHLVDFEREAVSLSKELAKLYTTKQQKNRRLDVLLKVFLLDGSEVWFLMHIEVQGYEDDDFNNRMFTSFYRLYELYRVPITSLVIYTDDKSSYHPKGLNLNFWGTTLSYHYNTYKVLDQNDEVLEASNNPIAIAILATKIAIEKDKLNDENDLVRLKLNIIRLLFKKGYSRTTVSHLVNFINQYIRIKMSANQELYQKEFETIVDDYYEVETIEDAILLIVKEEGKEEGIEIGKKLILEEVKRQEQESIIKMHSSNLEDAFIAELLSLDTEYVTQVIKDWQEQQKNEISNR
jgi:predicted transposase YdaD